MNLSDGEICENENRFIPEFIIKKKSIKFVCVCENFVVAISNGNQIHIRFEYL